MWRVHRRASTATRFLCVVFPFVVIFTNHKRTSNVSVLDPEDHQKKNKQHLRKSTILLRLKALNGYF
jgi:hypothetical protein